jgi:hypothetical protein
MRLPDELKNTAVFLGLGVSARDPSPRFIGTAFLVSVTEDDERIAYLVTAWHVKRDLYAHKDLYPIAQLNDEHGNAYSVSLRGVKWYEHPTDKGVDAVACPFDPPHDGSLSLGPGIFVHTSDIGGSMQRYGIGDEVAMVGLFRFAFDRRRNAPIVRTGNLAMVPSVRVPIKGYARCPNMEVYFVEARSLGGLSGSPVFILEAIRMRMTAHPITGEERWAGMVGAWAFLGMARAHFDIDAKTLNAAKPLIAEGGVNIGVASVVPGYKILEIVNSEAVRKERRKRVAMAKKKRRNEEATRETEDSALRGDQDNAPPFDPAVAALFQVPKEAVDAAEAKRAKRRRKK